MHVLYLNHSSLVSCVQVRALFDFVDEDMDGQLSFSEFFGLLTEMRVGLHSAARPFTVGLVRRLLNGASGICL